MALRFIDSFDHYATAGLDLKWTENNAATITAAALRTGIAGMQIGTQARYCAKTLDLQSTWIVGFAVFFGTLPTGATSIVAFIEGSTLHCDVRLNVSGQLTFTRNGTLLGTGTTVLVPGQKYYFECKVIISDTVGLGEVKLNNVLEIGYYGAGSAGSPTGDTRNGGTGAANVIRVGGGGTSGVTTNQNVDDLYICDGTGSAPTNTFLGDIKVEALLPSGNGNSSQFDGSDGNATDNYLLVDEAAPDDNTTYVESADVGDKDTYAYGNLVTTAGTVYGVQPVPYTRKTDAGSKTYNSVVRLSTSEVDSSAKAAFDSYTYQPDVREAKPGGGVWTVSDVNSAEFGIKVAS